MGARELSVFTEEDVMDLFRGATGLDGEILTLASEPGIAAEIDADDGCIYRITSSHRIHKTHDVVTLTEEEALEYDIRDFLPWGADVTVRRTPEGLYADLETPGCRRTVWAEEPDQLVALARRATA